MPSSSTAQYEQAALRVTMHDTHALAYPDGAPPVWRGSLSPPRATRNRERPAPIPNTWRVGQGSVASVPYITQMGPGTTTAELTADLRIMDAVSDIRRWHTEKHWRTLRPDEGC
ncbi:hypothetical protein BN946_scf184533.g6 [Trametes cinnabarina]|uniref:Uncharacterized protein n=1 Tax=Pycnoporus cinnabarinus TaxID=5643 RepID=A0A060SP21_PYCCI|nr:hypothetical protein BN946_scf184533.g6 [Trametes cinnabarina]